MSARHALAPAMAAALLAGCVTTEPMRSVDTSGDCVASLTALTAHPAFVPDPAKPKVVAKPVTGTDEKSGKVEGVKNSRISGDNVRDYRERVERMPNFDTRTGKPRLPGD